MIPHRTISTDIFGNGLNGRVKACRTRLRGNRSTLKAHVVHGYVDNQLGEVFPESLPSEFLVDHPAMRESLVRMDCCSSAFAGTEASEGDALLMVAEHEVGIT